MTTAEVMFAPSRKQAIAELVQERGNVTVAELCERFSMSPATIRNDLRDLEEHGLLERTHGGAITCHRSAYEPNTYQREDRFVKEKQCIAKLAAEQIVDGDIIALDNGTTTFELAKLLGKFNRLTVVTNDLQIAFWLEKNTDAFVIMIGGAVRHNFHCTGGQTALNSIGEMHFDKVFLAANGVTIDNGLSTPNMDMANIKTVLLRHSSKSFLLIDSSKLGRDAFAIFAKIKEVGAMITDWHASEEFIREATKEGVVVYEAKQ